MLRFTFIIAIITFSLPAFAQDTYPTYRMTNGVPDASGILVTNPNPTGGLLIYNSKNGQATMSPMKIREFQPADNDVFNGRVKSVKEPEMTFHPEMLPEYRQVSEFIMPIPLNSRPLEFEMPNYFKHSPSIQIAPTWNNPILEERKQGDFKLRED